RSCCRHRASSPREAGANDGVRMRQPASTHALLLAYAKPAPPHAHDGVAWQAFWIPGATFSLHRVRVHRLAAPTVTVASGPISSICALRAHRIQEISPGCG